MRNYQKPVKRLTAVQLIVTYYLLAVGVSFFLLNIPGVYKPGVQVSLIDSLFTAVSAVSVTGLTAVNIGDTYSTLGIIMLMIVLQIGGIGIMSIGTFFWLLIRRKIGLRERQLIMTDANQYSLTGIVKLIRQIVILIISIELIGGIILTLYLWRDFETLGEAFFNSLFMSISATTNAGFDLTGTSLRTYFNDYFVQFVTMILIVLGAIGFPVLAEVRMFFSRNKKKTFRFSLFTKITTTTFAILLFLGAFIIFILESLNSFKGLSFSEKVFASFFHSVSSRSAGLTTFDVTQFSDATEIMLNILMFIGASPSSAGGGIRTTTLAIAVLFLINFARKQEVIHIFHRKIKLVDVFRSYAVILLASLMVVVALIILLISEPTIPANALLFEITSAFGTCGMSLGVTSDLSIVGKCVIMILMFIGRVGLISFLFTLGGQTKKTHYHFPEERVIIG